MILFLFYNEKNGSLEVLDFLFMVIVIYFLIYCRKDLNRFIKLYIEWNKVEFSELGK